MYLHYSLLPLLMSEISSMSVQETQDSGQGSSKRALPSSSYTNHSESYWYASQMQSDRKPWISQGFRVITLGLDEALQLVSTHPSQPETLHQLIFFFFFVSYIDLKWRWRTWAVPWIHDANLFDMAKGCREIYHSTWSMDKVHLLF